MFQRMVPIFLLCGVLLAAAHPLAPQKAPAFEAPLLAGGTARLDDYKDKTLLVHFWATWCKPCLEELPRLERAQAQYGARGLAVLAIAVAEKKELVAAYVKSHALGLPVAFDEQARIAERYGVTGFPSSVLVAPDGTVAERFLSQSLSEEDLKRIGEGLE